MRHEIKLNPMNSNTVHQASNHKSFKGPRIFYKTYRKTIKVTLVNRDSRRKNNHAPRAVEKSSREESVPARGSWLGDIESYTLARRASIPRRFRENEETSRKERERIERGREGGTERERELWRGRKHTSAQEVASWRVAVETRWILKSEKSAEKVATRLCNGVKETRKKTNRERKRKRRRYKRRRRRNVTRGS